MSECSKAIPCATGQYIPAQAGFSVLQWAGFSREQRRVHLWREPIVAWRVEDGEPTPIGLSGAPEKGYAVQAADGMIYWNEETMSMDEFQAYQDERLAEWKDICKAA